MFKAVTRIDSACVPHKGSAQALNDLLSARVHLIRGLLATALLQVKASKLRILAVISAQCLESPAVAADEAMVLLNADIKHQAAIVKRAGMKVE